MAACVVIALANLPSLARADGDPASDVLLGAPVFYPYQPPTAAPIRRALEAELTQLKGRGLDLKVAIIDTEADLGAVSNTWNMPQLYARFLSREISFNRPQAVLVVMPAGFGTVHLGSPRVLGGLSVDSTHGADGFARSAATAVLRLAQANGKPISAPALPATARPAGKNSGTSPLLTFGAPVLIVILLAGAAALRQRREPDSHP